MAAALDSYRSEQEVSMAEKNQVIESLREELDDSERAKVRTFS